MNSIQLVICVCLVIPCPTYSTGFSVAIGCVCGPGTNGSVTRERFVLCMSCISCYVCDALIICLLYACLLMCLLAGTRACLPACLHSLLMSYLCICVFQVIFIHLCSSMLSLSPCISVDPCCLYIIHVIDADFTVSMLSTLMHYL